MSIRQTRATERVDHVSKPTELIIKLLIVRRNLSLPAEGVVVRLSAPDRTQAMQ